VARFCNYLPQCGIDPVILTVQERYCDRLDHTFRALPGLRVVCAPQQLGLLEHYGRWKARSNGAASRRNTQRSAKKNSQRVSLRRQIVGVLGARGESWGWFQPAVQAAERLICERKFDAMLSSGPPHVAHSVARFLHRKYRIPWLADFRDPWALDSFDSHLPNWTRHLALRREQACVQEADRVICNTARMREDFCIRYPDIDREKLVTLTNGFEDMPPAEYPSSADDSRELILHLGSVYGSRRLDTFCQALRKLEKEGMDVNRLRVLFVGDVEDRLVSQVQEKVPDLMQRGIIEFLATMSWDDAQKLLWSAKVLLVFQGDYRIQVPAKFYEYLATGKPIFAVVVRGALSELVELTASGTWAPPLDVDKIARQLSSVLKLPGLSASEAQMRWRKQFHFASLAQQLAQTIERTVSEVAANGIAGAPATYDVILGRNTHRTDSLRSTACRPRLEPHKG